MPEKKKNREQYSPLTTIIACYRKIAIDRLLALGLQPLKLSQGGHHTSITILHTPDLPRNTSRVLILLPDDNSDLGTWSIRSIDGEGGHFGTGCMESIVSRAIREGYSVIIGNTGELFYDPDRGTTMTLYSWMNRQKPWRLGGQIRQFDPTWNLVKGSEDPEAHVQLVFEGVVKKLVPKQTKIYVVAVGVGAGALVQYLDRTYDSQWAPQLYACAFAEPAYSISALTSPCFKAFLNKLARAYTVHSVPRGTQITDTRFGCCTISADTLHTELVVPLMQETIMDYFELARSDPEWCNPRIVMEDWVFNGEGKDGVAQAMEEVRIATGEGATWGDGTPGCVW